MLWRLEGPWLTLPGFGDGLERIAWLENTVPNRRVGAELVNCTHSFWSIGKKPCSVSCSRSTFAVRWRHGLGIGSIVKVLLMSDIEDRCPEAQGLVCGSVAEGSLAWLSWQGWAFGSDCANLSAQTHSFPSRALDLLVGLWRRASKTNKMWAGDDFNPSGHCHPLLAWQSGLTSTH